MSFLLLRDYIGQPCEGFLMSEKMDGHRVMVQDGQLVTRGGNTLDAPQWFTDGLPDGIDSELYAGRGEFNSIQGRMRDGWHGLRLMAFDVVMAGTFRQRLAYLKTLSLPGHVEVVEHILCRGTQHLLEFADTIVADGGEGVAVRDGSAKYQAGRSDDVLRWVPQDPALSRRRVA